MVYRRWIRRNDKAYSIREVSISREISLYAFSLSLSLFLSTGTFYDTAIIAMQYPSIHPFSRQPFPTTTRPFLFLLENGGFSFLFETDSEHFSFSSARLTRLIRTLEFLGIFATTVVMAVFPVQALSFPLLKSDYVGHPTLGFHLKSGWLSEEPVQTIPRSLPFTFSRRQKSFGEAERCA